MLLRTAVERADDADHWLYRRADAISAPAVDTALEAVTTAADRSALWVGVSVLLLAAGQRRAAARGMTALLVASAVANLPSKVAADRARPQPYRVPLPRRVTGQPSTGSFPSGHSASAAAFATAVALASPRPVAAPVGVLAAGVCLGRVRTGVHYPGDVLAGAALGATTALLLARARRRAERDCPPPEQVPPR
jgi:undecaprenyl-diphosphatase